MPKKEEVMVKEKEIYNTSLIDKNLPTIKFSSKNVESSLDWDEIEVSVSDASGKEALGVFRSVLSELGMGKKD